MLATLYFLLIVISAVLICGLAVLAWTRRHTPVGLPFFWMLATSALMPLLYIAILLSPARDVAYRFALFTHIVSGLAAICFLWFSLVYTGVFRRVRQIHLLPLYLLLSVFAAVVLTDPLHGWYYSDYTVQRVGGFTFQRQDFNGGFYLYNLYLMVLYFVAVAALLLGLRRARGSIRWQHLWIIIAASMPVLFAFVAQFLRSTPLEDAVVLYNPWPLSYTVLAVLLTRTLIRDQLLDLMPIAQPLVLAEIPAAVIVTDLHGRITDTNPVARAIKGLDANAAVGLPLAQVFPELTGSTDGESLVIQCADRPGSSTFELTRRSLHDGDRPIGTLTILYDVTARRRAEATYRSVVEQSLQGFAIYHEGRPVFVNQTLAEMAGHTVESYLRLSAQEVIATIHDDDRDRITDLMRSMRRGERSTLTDEFRAFRRDGTTFWLEIRAHLADYEGLPVIQVAMIDITERKRAQQRELDIALERERVRLLTNFIQGSAHEFRTPLSVIMSSAYLLLKAPDHDTRTVRVAQINAQVGQVTYLVDMLLKIAQLDSAAPTMLRIVIDDIVREACERAAVKFETTRIQFDQAATRLTVTGNSHFLGEALTALLDNACRYSPPGAAVRVRVTTVEGQALIAVADAGPGIAAESLPFIFDTFWRADTAHATPGLGLGLALARKVARLHDGSITVETTPGQGSTFYLALPLAAADTPTTLAYDAS